jgi:hypothetical protein
MTATVQNNLGEALTRQRRFAEAEPLIRLALKVGTEAGGRPSLSVCVCVCVCVPKLAQHCVCMPLRCLLVQLRAGVPEERSEGGVSTAQPSCEIIYVWCNAVLQKECHAFPQVPSCH